jgi:hypothetical protein
VFGQARHCVIKQAWHCVIALLDVAIINLEIIKNLRELSDKNVLVELTVDLMEIFGVAESKYVLIKVMTSPPESPLTPLNKGGRGTLREEVLTKNTKCNFCLTLIDKSPIN